MLGISLGTPYFITSAVAVQIDFAAVTEMLLVMRQCKFYALNFKHSTRALMLDLRDKGGYSFGKVVVSLHPYYAWTKLR